MSEILKFAGREEFREWLHGHCLSSAGVWLLFGKAGGPKTIKAGEVPEEALCFGWIDGQMEKIACLYCWKAMSPLTQIFRPCLHL